jgi:hypothetical protein
MRSSAVLFLALAAISLTSQADTLARFEGDSNERTPVFEPGGPWMLYWYTQSDNALPKTFELRLYRADSGEYLGTVIQQRIIANGKKLFEDAGSYSLDVVAGNIDWTLVVSEIDKDKAAQLIREAEGQPTIGDSAQQYANQVAEDNFESWRPVDDQTLLLFAPDESHGFRVTFDAPCTGLKEATALTFVSSGVSSDGELYDSIMLDDGMHCEFARVIPTVFD